jgi:hypothetical protein
MQWILANPQRNPLNDNEAANMYAAAGWDFGISHDQKIKDAARLAAAGRSDPTAGVVARYNLEQKDALSKLPKGFDLRGAAIADTALSRLDSNVNESVKHLQKLELDLFGPAGRSSVLSNRSGKTPNAVPLQRLENEQKRVATELKAAAENTMLQLRRQGVTDPDALAWVQEGINQIMVRVPRPEAYNGNAGPPPPARQGASPAAAPAPAARPGKLSGMQ